MPIDKTITVLILIPKIKQIILTIIKINQKIGKINMKEIIILILIIKSMVNIILNKATNLINQRQTILGIKNDLMNLLCWNFGHNLLQ